MRSSSAAAIDAILVTRGEAGMTLVARGGKPLHVRAETHRVFDVTGAGDTVVATLAAALAVGVPLADAVRLANTAAGIAVTKPGTATVEPAELRLALGAHGAAGIVDRAEAADRIAGWKAQRLKVGFTNGCFDLLHRGHLYSLEQASRRVDRLVVGVNSDASARRLKGAGRPVQDLATRAAVLAALRVVDLVVPFEEDTPEKLIRALAGRALQGRRLRRGRRSAATSSRRMAAGSNSCRSFPATARRARSSGCAESVARRQRSLAAISTRASAPRESLPVYFCLNFPAELVSPRGFGERA